MHKKFLNSVSSSYLSRLKQQTVSKSTTHLINGQVELIELNLDQIQALSSPATNDVFWSFSFTDPMSAREVSYEIGKASSTTGYHIDKLISVGLLIKAGTRKRRSRIEQLYVQAANKVRANLAGKPEEFYEAANKGFAALTRSMSKEREAAYEAMFVDHSWSEKMIYRTVRVYLKPEDAAIAFELIEKLHTHVRNANVSPEEAANSESIKRFHVFSNMTPTKSESKKHMRKNRKK